MKLKGKKGGEEIVDKEKWSGWFGGPMVDLTRIYYAQADKKVRTLVLLSTVEPGMQGNS